LFAYNSLVDISEVQPPENLSARQRLLIVCAAMIAGIRTRNMQPVNTTPYHRAIEESVTIADEVLRTCFRRFPEIFR
jgi:hypothetical protein